MKSLNSYLQLWIISSFNVLIFLRSGHNSRSYIAALTNQSFDLQYFLKCIAFNTQLRFFCRVCHSYFPIFSQEFQKSPSTSSYSEYFLERIIKLYFLKRCLILSVNGNIISFSYKRIPHGMTCVLTNVSPLFSWIEKFVQWCFLSKYWWQESTVLGWIPAFLRRNPSTPDPSYQL